MDYKFCHVRYRSLFFRFIYSPFPEIFHLLVDLIAECASFQKGNKNHKQLVQFRNTSCQTFQYEQNVNV